ncbi:MAG TPA: class I SAM-dependent methyltransferase [Verrucomicrobiae bacterium]|jgi:ubiquinone/menaquinone biosynthesis C-methylase UbiE
MSFDTLAPHYRWMEWLLAGRKLQRCRTAFLEEVRDAQNVLLLGEGNGRFLSEFVRINPSANITVLDASQGMLKQAQRRLPRKLEGNRSQIQYVHANVFAWTIPLEHFDLMVSNFFFDCFRAEQLAVLVPRLARATRERARWIISDFQIPPRGLAHWRARWIVAAMYCFFRIVTRLPARAIAPVDSLLQSARFELRTSRVSEWGLLHADLWQRPGSNAACS